MCKRARPAPSKHSIEQTPKCLMTMWAAQYRANSGQARAPSSRLAPCQFVSVSRPPLCGLQAPLSTLKTPPRLCTIPRQRPELARVRRRACSVSFAVLVGTPPIMQPLRPATSRRSILSRWPAPATAQPYLRERAAHRRVLLYEVRSGSRRYAPRCVTKSMRK